MSDETQCAHCAVLPDGAEFVCYDCGAAMVSEERDRIVARLLARAETEAVTRDRCSLQLGDAAAAFAAEERRKVLVEMADLIAKEVT
jgi:hypothetical protein